MQDAERLVKKEKEVGRENEKKKPNKHQKVGIMIICFL